MAKLDLKVPLGIPIILEDNLITNENIKIEEVRHFSIDQIRSELLNQEVEEFENLYSIYRGIDYDNLLEEKKVMMNLYVIPSRITGIEYIKTNGMLCNKTRVLDVVNGTGVIVLQNFEDTYEGDIIITSIKKGHKIIVPANYHASFTNTKSTTLVISEFVSKSAKFIEDLDDMNGMAYYVIRKNAKQEIVQNPVYRMVSKLRKVNWDTIATKQGLTLKTPVLKQIIRKYEKMSWIYNNSPITI